MRYALATDGSESSLKAARFLLAHSCPAREDEIFVVHVFPLPPNPESYAELFSLPTDATDERVKKAAAPVFEKTRAALSGAESRLHEVLLLGNPAEEIVEFACNVGVDLIVVGTQGHSAAKELALGSVSSAVAHRALCPVLIAR